MLRAVCCIAILCPLVAPAAAQEWTRFRGPNGSGVGDADHIPVRWTPDDYNWRVELPGIGHSSPVLWGGKLFITGGDPATGDVTLLCLDADDGHTLWSREIDSSVHHLHRRNSFASSTPAVDASRVYLAVCTPERYRLIAFDHDGNEKWQRDLGAFESQHGFGTSPIVYEDVVVIGNDQMAAGFLIALDRTTGEVAWKRPREFRRTAYSTPCVHRPEGKPPELIFNSGANGISGVDPKTGEINWEIDTFDKRSVSSPIVAAGLIYGSCGSGGGGNYVVAVRPGGSPGDKPELVYKIDRSAPYVPSPVAHGDLVFLWYDKGIVTCLDAPSGKVHWQKRVGGNYSGSPIRVGDRLYCIDEEGEVVVLAASQEYRELARNPLGEASRATPAVARGQMYLRTDSGLLSVGGKRGGAKDK